MQLTELQARATAAVQWTAIAVVFNTTLQMGQVIVIARLLGPELVGLMGMVMVIVGFAQAFADAGLAGAIVQRKNTTREQLSSLYWLTVAVGLTLALVVVVSSPLVALWYREPRLLPLLPWAALSFAITPLGHQFQVLLQKNLRFRTLSSIDVASATMAATVAIGSAWLGHGVYSMIWGQLSSVVTRTILLGSVGFANWPPMLRFRVADLDGYLGFGLYQMGERGIDVAVQRMDQFTIGRVAGAESLGFYNQAFSLVTYPVARVANIFGNVAFPLLARVQDDTAQMRKVYLTVLSVIMLLNSPALLGIAAVSPHFVPLALGEEWTPAIPLLQVLSLVALSRAHGNPVGALVMARGRADLSFQWSLGIAIGQVPILWLGSWLNGALGAALALLALQAVLVVLNYRILIRTLLGPCLDDYAPTVLRPVVVAGLMAMVVMSTGHFLGAPAWWKLALLVAEGVVVYAGLGFVLLDREVSTLREWASMRHKVSQQPASIETVA